MKKIIGSGLLAFACLVGTMGAVNKDDVAGLMGSAVGMGFAIVSLASAINQQIKT